jgi:hypothetical protein
MAAAMSKGGTDDLGSKARSTYACKIFSLRGTGASNDLSTRVAEERFSRYRNRAIEGTGQVDAKSLLQDVNRLVSGTYLERCLSRKKNEENIICRAII